MTVRIVHKNSTAEDKRPTAGQLANGEIAVNLNAAGAFLSVKDTAGNIQQVGGIKVSKSSPANPVLGTLWVDSDVNTLYVYDGSLWREIIGGSGGSGGDDVIAGDGLGEKQSGNVVELFVRDGPGIFVNTDAGKDWVEVDLEDDADRTGGSGLELTDTDETGQLRAKVATDDTLGVVMVDDSTIKVDINGVIKVDDSIASGLNIKGTLNITTTGTADAEPATRAVGDLYVSNQDGTITSSGTNWQNLLEGSDTTTDVGDFIICKDAAGGANNWLLVKGVGGSGGLWLEDAAGFLYPADNTNELRIPALQDGQEDDTGTDVALLDDNGQFVRAEAEDGVEINSDGNLALDPDFVPGTPADGEGRLGYWTRTDSTDMLRPATLGDNIELRSAADAVTISFNSDGTAEFTGDVTISSDGFLKLPEGDDSERPSTPAAGMIRFTDQDLDPGAGTDPANHVEMYNGSQWVQMLDETAVGTSPDQVPANQMLGQMAFIDHVATLRPFTTPLANTLPVFVGECIVIWDDTNHELVYRYRDSATTYRQATVAFGAQVTG